MGRREYLKLKYERKVRRMGVRRERWEEQGEEVRGVELLMPLAVVLLRRDPKVRLGFGGHKVGSRNMHAVRGVLAVGRHLPS